jgi:hypothetical protein
MGGHLTNEIVKQPCQRCNQISSMYFWRTNEHGQLQINEPELVSRLQLETIGNITNLSKSANQIYIK